MNAIKTTFFYLISLAIIVSCTDKTKSGTITQKKVIDYKELKMKGLLAYYLFEENLLTDEDSIIGRLNDSIKEYKNYNFITFEFSDSINDYIRLRFEKYQEDPYTISCIKTRNVFTYSFIDDDTILVNGDFIENSTLIYDSMITFINHPYDTSYSFNYP